MKKKIFIAALAICLVVISIAGSSVAYFTDTKQYTNVFTVGSKVAIEIVVDGVSTADTQNLLSGEGIEAYPGQEISKSIVVKNVGSDAYVGAIISFANTGRAAVGELISKTTGSSGVAPIAVTEFIKGLDTVNNTVKVSDDGLTVYVIRNEAVTNTANENEVSVLSGVTIPHKWNNSEMDKFNGVSMSVTGYAVQTAGFSDPITALQTAFDAFDTLPAN